MFSKSRIFMLVAVLAVLVVMTATLVSAAAPDVVGVLGNPPSTIFTTDGNPAEWGTLGTTNLYWFASTCTGSGGGSINCANPTGDLYLSFTCSTNTLNVLFVARPGTSYAVGDSTNNWIKITGVNGNVIQDGIPYTTNTAPNMWRDLSSGNGYEAAIDKVGKNNAGSPFTPGGTYTMNFHAFVNGVTSGTNDTTVIIPCTPTAVTLSTFQAQHDGLTLNNVVVPGIAAFGGILVLAGLLSVWYLGFRHA